MATRKSQVYHYHDAFGKPVVKSEDEIERELKPIDKAAREGYEEMQRVLKNTSPRVMKDILTGNLPVRWMKDDNGQVLPSYRAIKERIDEVGSSYWQKTTRFRDVMISNFHADLPQKEGQHLWWIFRRNYKTDDEFYSFMGEKISKFYRRPIDAKKFSEDVDAVLKEMKFDYVKYGEMYKLRSNCRFEDEVQRGAELLGLDISKVENLMDIRKYVEVELDCKVEQIAFEVFKNLRKKGYAIPQRKRSEQVQQRDDKAGGLENKIIPMISIVCLIGAIIFLLLPNITGNVIGVNNVYSNWIGGYCLLSG